MVLYYRARGVCLLLSVSSVDMLVFITPERLKSHISNSQTNNHILVHVKASTDDDSQGDKTHFGVR